MVGYGQLGKYLVNAIRRDPLCSDFIELAFVWNRTDAAVASDSNVPPHCHLKNLENFADMGADLIVEVAHPSITQEYGHIFLEKADYMVHTTLHCIAVVLERYSLLIFFILYNKIGSPTALADQGTEARILGAANSIEWKTGLYIPTGALWGARDIQV